MPNLIVSVLMSLINKVPLGSYRTYIINAFIIVAWVVFMLSGGNTELGALAIGAAMSNIFQRKSNEAQTTKMIYIEGMLQELTVQLDKKSDDLR